MSKSFGKFEVFIVGILLFLVGGMVGYVALKSSTYKVGPGTVADRVTEVNVGWVAYSASGKGISDGVFICDRPRSVGDYARLCRSPTSRAEWVGIVVILPADHTAEGCVLIGNLALFGDETMIEIIIPFIK